MSEQTDIAADQHFESLEFYQQMQAYRNAPGHEPAAVIAAFEAVKAFCEARVLPEHSWHAFIMASPVER
jgi:hypothetical protein